MNLSGEAVLISALINNYDALGARSFGVSDQHFIGYKAEYTWLLNYEATYGCCPSRDAFLVAFPTFRFSDHEDIRSAADMVLKAYAKQQMNAAISEATELMGLGDVDLAHKALTGVELRRAKPPKNPLLTQLSFLDDWDQPLSTIDTPYRIVNRHTGGIQPGNLWYLAARPGQGKSAHLVNIVKHAVLQGCKVKFYSLEMNEAEVRARFHAAFATHYGYTGIDLNGIRHRSIETKVYKAFVGELADRLKDTGGTLDIHTPRDGMVSPGVVAASAEEYHLNVVDYVGLMKSDAGTRAVDDWRIAAGISNDLKLVAGASSSGVLAAAQINREGDHGTEPPKIRNLAQSDALAQDGDVVLTLRSGPHDAYSVMSLEKNRHGMGGIKFHTTFDPNHGVFNEITPEQAEDLALAAEDR